MLRNSQCWADSWLLQTSIELYDMSLSTPKFMYVSDWQKMVKMCGLLNLWRMGLCLIRATAVVHYILHCCGEPHCEKEKENDREPKSKTLGKPINKVGRAGN